MAKQKKEEIKPGRLMFTMPTIIKTLLTITTIGRIVKIIQQEKQFGNKADCRLSQVLPIELSGSNCLVMSCFKVKTLKIIFLPMSYFLLW